MAENEPEERVDLLAAAVAAWPVLAKWQRRLATSPRFQALQRLWQNQRFQQGLRVAILASFVLFMGVAVYRNWNELRQYPWRLDARYAALAVASFPLAFVPTIWCWHWIIRRIGGHAEWRVNTHIFCMSSLGRYVPGAIWYVAGRAYWYRDYGVSVAQVALATLWENVVFITSGLIVYLLLVPHRLWLAGLIAVAAVALYPPLLNALGRRVQLAPLRWLDVLALLGTLGLAWLAGGVLLWGLANAFSPLSIDTVPFLTGIWGMAGAVSIVAGFLVGGLGIRELTLGALLGQVLPLPVGVAVALAFRLMLTVSEGLWVLILGWLTRPTGKSPKRISRFWSGGAPHEPDHDQDTS